MSTDMTGWCALCRAGSHDTHNAALGGICVGCACPVTAAYLPSVTDNARAEAAVARALFIEDNAPMARPGNGDYDFFSQRWEERHASGNSRTSADYRYKARVALAALDEWAAGRAETTTEVPRLSIEDGYLIAHVDRCTCDPHYGAHEIHCGIVDHQQLDNLPGWPGTAETTTATDEDAAQVIAAHTPTLVHEGPNGEDDGQHLYCVECGVLPIDEHGLQHGPEHVAEQLRARGLLATARTRPTP